ncbi:hypothetical protein SDRG_04905 [Saprolegnia diclina VS20]|uniref:Uncharacterized protein n=1 Tax=Saprolegnia diclina (strain VS20) TaxID=1156394 RepID=T0QIQ9_SAPDV|nr:hypothetical protein SDRG_04905 [Saprolegnia diclina VS20]EQC37884.1 hypothetical protein SDRG_04905 [Saprolegnia diclina VS20]|eukprot:XP_008608817.1 hypothetical protein SDRG_04905 [Saprolegnia diclina VS20]
MAEKLATELQIPGISPLQLQDMTWKTKEKVLLLLLEKNASSEPIYDELKNLAADRRQERAFEKTDGAMSKDALRKKEDSYRASFMKVVAKELARMGAPSLVTWQRLVLDKDCTYQAIRILLTKIKSSQKKRSGSALLPLLEPKTRPSTMDDKPMWISTSEPETKAVTPPRSATLIPTKPAKAVVKRPASPKPPASNQVEEVAPDMVVQRVTTAPKPAKLKVDPKLQAALLENEALRKEIDHLEGLTATLLQSSDEPLQGPSADRRVRFLKAQNHQLQRQVDMLLDAVAARESAATDLQALLHALNQAVEAGLADAKEAGADQTKKKWMLAVPRDLQQTIKQTERQLLGLNRSLGASMEQKLRHSDDGLLDDNYTVLRVRDVHNQHSCHGPLHMPNVQHLRFDRLQQIESHLAQLTSQLLGFAKDATEATPPLISDAATMRLHDQARDLARHTRALATETASLGAVVCVHAVGPGFEHHHPSRPTVAAIVAELPPFPSAHKEREKGVRLQLQRLDAHLSGVEARLEQGLGELASLQQNVRGQASAWRTMLQNVDTVFTKKVQWAQEALTAALDGIVQVFDAFKAQQVHGGINPYGNLLVETFETQRSALVQVRQSYTQYAATARAKLDASLADMTRAIESVTVSS